MITYSDTIAKNVEIAITVPRSRMKSDGDTTGTLHVEPLTPNASRPLSARCSHNRLAQREARGVGAPITARAVSRKREDRAARLIRLWTRRSPAMKTNSDRASTHALGGCASWCQYPLRLWAKPCHPA